MEAAPLHQSELPTCCCRRFSALSSSTARSTCAFTCSRWAFCSSPFAFNSAPGSALPGGTVPAAHPWRPAFGLDPGCTPHVARMRAYARECVHVGHGQRRLVHDPTATVGGLHGVRCGRLNLAQQQDEAVESWPAAPPGACRSCGGPQRCHAISVPRPHGAAGGQRRRGAHHIAASAFPTAAAHWEGPLVGCGRGPPPREPPPPAFALRCLRPQTPRDGPGWPGETVSLSGDESRPRNGGDTTLVALGEILERKRQELQGGVAGQGQR